MEGVSSVAASAALTRASRPNLLCRFKRIALLNFCMITSLPLSSQRLHLAALSIQGDEQRGVWDVCYCVS